jgi:hypothetical protein
MITPEIGLTQRSPDVAPKIVPDCRLDHPIGTSLAMGTHELNVTGGPAVTGSLTIPDEILERLDRVGFGVHTSRQGVLDQLQGLILQEVVGTLPHFRISGTTGDSAELGFEAIQECFDGFGGHLASLFGDQMWSGNTQSTSPKPLEFHFSSPHQDINLDFCSGQGILSVCRGQPTIPRLMQSWPD